MLFQQMTEAADGRLIRCQSRTKIHAEEPLQHQRLIQRLLYARVGQVEPLLHEVSPQQDLKHYRTTPVARHRIVQTNQRQHPHHGMMRSIIQEQLPAALPTKLLELHLTRKRPLARRSLPSAVRLNNQDADAELVQSLPGVYAQCSNFNVR
jgi:hypothetical protein